MMAFASVVEDVIERSGIRDDVKDLLRKQRAREAYEREQAKKQEAENLAMVEQVLGDMKREEADVARVEKELAELERREAAGEVTMAEVDAKREQLLRERAEVEESRKKVKELDLSHAASQKAQALMEQGIAELDRAEQEGASPTYDRKGGTFADAVAAVQANVEDLTYLDLENMNLRDEMMPSLSKALATNTNLKTLDISFNSKLTDEGIKELLPGLRKSTVSEIRAAGCDSLSRSAAASLDQVAATYAAAMWARQKSQETQQKSQNRLSTKALAWDDKFLDLATAADAAESEGGKPAGAKLVVDVSGDGGSAEGAGDSGRLSPVDYDV